jgi:hypothetical protein
LLPPSVKTRYEYLISPVDLEEHRKMFMSFLELATRNSEQRNRLKRSSRTGKKHMQRFGVER